MHLEQEHPPIRISKVLSVVRCGSYHELTPYSVVYSPIPKPHPVLRTPCGIPGRLTARPSFLPCPTGPAWPPLPCLHPAGQSRRPRLPAYTHNAKWASRESLPKLVSMMRCGRDKPGDTGGTMYQGSRFVRLQPYEYALPSCLTNVRGCCCIQRPGCRRRLAGHKLCATTSSCLVASIETRERQNRREGRVAENIVQG